jgi:hypothetical protein
MSNKNRRFLRYSLACVILLLLLVYFFRSALHGSRRELNQGTAIPAVESNRQLVSRTGEDSSAPVKLDAKDIDAAKAKKIIANALWAIVNAKSYRMVMTSYYSSSDPPKGLYASFTLVHDKSVTRGDLFRCDTIYLDEATMKPLPGLSRVQISNELGNWEMGDGAGREGVAFLLKNNEDPSETIGMNNGFRTNAQTIDSPDDNDSFSVANGTVGGKPVLLVTRTIALTGPQTGTTVDELYTIDAANGTLLSMGSPLGNGIVQRFELNPAIDDSDFNIPDSQVVAPVSSVPDAQKYLMEHK